MGALVGLTMSEQPEQQERQLTWGKKLAHNDKKVRDKTVKVLRAWLSKQPEMSELDTLKLWKGLFYCFWMSDKRPVQRELAQTIASLVASAHEQCRLEFIKGFWVTMLREWSGIDRLRLDKYYVLVELFLESSFAALVDMGWDDEAVDAFVTNMESSVFAVNQTCGLSMFLVKNWLKRLRMAPEVPMESLGKLIEPFFSVLSKTADKQFVRLVITHVFEPLLPSKMSQDETLIADLPEMVDLLFQLASSRETREGNRKFLYEMHGQYESCLKSLEDAMAADQEQEADMSDADEDDVEQAEQAAREAFGSDDDDEVSEEEVVIKKKPKAPKKTVKKGKPVAAKNEATPSSKKRQQQTKEEPKSSAK